jgi:hypothetical protein
VNAIDVDRILMLEPLERLIEAWLDSVGICTRLNVTPDATNAAHDK